MSSPAVHRHPIILMPEPIIVTNPKARRPQPITNLQTHLEGASVIAHIGPFFACGEKKESAKAHKKHAKKTQKAANEMETRPRRGHRSPRLRWPLNVGDARPVACARLVPLI